MRSQNCPADLPAAILDHDASGHDNPGVAGGNVYLFRTASQPAFALQFHFGSSNGYVNLTSEGGISFGEGYTPELAAHEFWTAMAVHNPMRARIEALEAVLRRVVHDYQGLDDLSGSSLHGAVDSARELLGMRAACTFHNDCRACEDLAVSCWRSALRHAQEP